MKKQLVMLPQPILVSDEKIKDGDRFYSKSGIIFDQEGNNPHDKESKKIIAGIPDLPSINFSALSEEDCKKIGWVDVDRELKKIFIDYYKDIENFDVEERWNFLRSYDVMNFYVNVFKTAQSLNEKKFSEEDMRKAWNTAYVDAMSIDEETYKPLFFEDFIKSLSQTKIFDVEAELDAVSLGEPNPNDTKLVYNIIRVL